MSSCYPRRAMSYVERERFRSRVCEPFRLHQLTSNSSPKLGLQLDAGFVLHALITHASLSNIFISIHKHYSF